MTNVSFISVSSPLIKFYFLTTKYFQIIYFICSSIVWESVFSSYSHYHSLSQSPPQQNFRQLFFSFRKVRGCGCSFVAKLSWKKNFFFEKIFVFFTKYTLVAEKNNFYWLYWFILIILILFKNLYWFFLLKKLFLQKMKKRSHLRNIFLSRKYIFILKKNFFWS